MLSESNTPINPARTEHSIFHNRNYWYIAASSKKIKKKPIRVMLWNTPIVLFRDTSGSVHALLDRCAHRNVPLSTGTVQSDRIQCPYHGWEFDGSGTCQHIPARVEDSCSTTRNVPSFPVREQQGYIWVYTNNQTSPNHEPYQFPFLEEKGFRTIHYQADFDATILATAENVLDVPHTAFLHKGLFRSGNRNIIEAQISRFAHRAECSYVGEPRPTGILGSLIAPKGGEIEHIDRFILPSVAQVEYRLGNQMLMSTSFLSPISDFVTRMYAVVSVKLSFVVPGLQSIVTPFALRIVRQDIDMLKQQTEQVQFFGGERYNYTELDVLAPSIRRLLKKANQQPLALYQDEEEEEPEYAHKTQLRV
jgi:phenylpropionate dioxygenase-like ring-hydroxylating dioxygenase large terminal subunit